MVAPPVLPVAVVLLVVVLRAVWLRVRPTADVNTGAAGGREPEEPGPATEPTDGWVDPASVGEPYGTEVAGLLTFRGPRRSCGP